MSSGSFSNPVEQWQFHRQVVTGTADVTVKDKSGVALPANAHIKLLSVSDNSTGDGRIKLHPTDLATDVILVSGASSASWLGFEWDDASSLRLSTSAAVGRAVFVFKYRLP